MIQLSAPGIILNLAIFIIGSTNLVTEGDVSITYTSSENQNDSITVNAAIIPSYIGGEVCSIQLRIPTQTSLPGYPVDRTQALPVPDEPTEYIRTIYVDGVLVQTETITLRPEDVRASITMTRVYVEGDWFTRGDFNSDGLTDIEDWNILLQNWQQEWRGRLLAIEAFNNFLNNVEDSPAKYSMDMLESDHAPQKHCPQHQQAKGTKEEESDLIDDTQID